MVTGAGSTATVNTSHQVRDVSPKLQMLDADEMPLRAILQAIGSGGADLYKFEWAEFGGDWFGVGNFPRHTSVDTTTGTGTTIQVDNATYGNVGDLVKVVRTGEIMLITAVASPNWTVVRAVGSTTVAAVADNDDLVIVPSGFGEGTARAIANLAEEAFVYNYAQLFKTAASMNNTETAGKNYLGDTRNLERMKALRKHKEGVELAYLWGERNRITTTPANPINLTGGCHYWNTVNRRDAGGTLTIVTMESHLEDVFAHTGGGPTRTLFASSKICSVMDIIAIGQLQVMQDDSTFGLAVKQWKSSHGSVNIFKHRFLDQGPNNAPALAAGGHGGFGMTLDLSKIRERALRPMKLETNVQDNGDDLWVDQYVQETGLEFVNAALHGEIYDVSG
jgi:hypothetical protein